MIDATETVEGTVVDSSLIPVKEFTQLSQEDMLTALYISHQQMIQLLDQIKDQIMPVVDDLKNSAIGKMMGL